MLRELLSRRRNSKTYFGKWQYFQLQLLPWKNIKTIPPRRLCDLFSEVINVYTCCSEFGKEAEDIFGGSPIWEEIQNDWDIFEIDNIRIHEELLKDICKDIFFDEYGWTCKFDGNVVFYLMQTSYYEQENGEQINLWRNFCEEILTRNRFFVQNSLDLELLKFVLEISQKEVKVGSKYSRCRSSLELIPPNKMGMPPSESATPGRANPIGIPYLYLSESDVTCAIETRLEINTTGTIGVFHVLDSIRIADLAHPGINSPFKFGNKLHDVVLYQGFLKHISSELSKPIDKSKEYLYTPTQYLCEYIKSLGFEGVQFKSSKTEKLNLTLFNESKVKCLTSKFFKLCSEDNLEYK